jgi:hypothetical protein
MALPQQVQAALDAAEATLAATNAPSAPDVSPVEPALDAQPQPDPFGDAPQQVAAPVEPPAPQPKDDVWEARYKSLQGLFNKEVPELQHRVKTLQSNLDEAIQRLNRASEKQESTPAQRPAADPKDVDNFGQDLVDMVSRVSSQAIGQMAQMFEAKFSHIEAKLEGMGQTLQGATQQVAVSAEQAFFDRVTKLVPNWEEVNTQPAFLTWLNEVDPVYGVERHVALKRAQSTLNADHAAAVFNAFLGPKPQAKKVDPLDSQVSPRGAATVAPTPVEKPVLTQAQITKFYDDVRRGNYRGQDAEVARIEQVINAALAEGRVR